MYVNLFHWDYRDAICTQYNFSYPDCLFAARETRSMNATYGKRHTLKQYFWIPSFVLSTGEYLTAVIHTRMYRNNSERTPAFARERACIIICVARWTRACNVHASLRAHDPRTKHVPRALSQIRNWYTYRPAGVHSLNGITTRRQRHHAGQVDACSTFFTSNDFNATNRFCGFAQVRKQRTTDKSLITVTRPA